MAGHSKWANIKHRKAKEDAKKGKVFTRLIREVTVAARTGGGGDVAHNPRLRDAVLKAKACNMSGDTIDRAIKRGVGVGDDAQLEEIMYEGYGPSGVAVLVQCMSDNRNRTVGEVRHAFTKRGGNLGTEGSVSYLFKKQGILSFAPGANEEILMEKAILFGAEDVVTHDDGSIDVVTTPEDFFKIKEALELEKLTPAHAEVAMEAALKIAVNDKEAAEKVTGLLDALEELDDVQSVYSNADIHEDLL